MKEQDIIQTFFTRPSDDSSIITGIGDDAAILQTQSEHHLVITTDTLVEGIHFLSQAPPYQIGYKLMATNLSDIAAMGAQPKWATLNLNLPEINKNWLQEFSNGLFMCADKHQVALIGGDTTHSPTLSMSVQLMGEVTAHHSMCRNSAKPEENIYVTGVLGKAAEAMKKLLLHEGDHEVLSQQQILNLYQPSSRVELAMELRHFVKTAIDISDGLLHELEIICHHSHTGAQLFIDKIPMINEELGLEALTFGEDYELLFTASPAQDAEIIRLAKMFHCPITMIGTITEASGIKLFQNNNEVAYPATTGYDHFQ